MNKEAKEWLEAARDALIIVAVLYFICWPVKVIGVSMQDTLFEDDRIAISRLMTFAEMYSRGDIIVVKAELDGKPSNLVKRVIAKGGDYLEIKDGTVSVNGEILEEEYVDGPTRGGYAYTIPEGCVFVMGDNRSESTDSRDFGYIGRDRIQGKVLFKFLPFNDIKLL